MRSLELEKVVDFFQACCSGKEIDLKENWLRFSLGFSQKCLYSRDFRDINDFKGQYEPKWTSFLPKSNVIILRIFPLLYTGCLTLKCPFLNDSEG